MHESLVGSVRFFSGQGLSWRRCYGLADQWRTVGHKRPWSKQIGDYWDRACLVADFGFSLSESARIPSWVFYPFLVRAVEASLYTTRHQLYRPPPVYNSSINDQLPTSPVMGNNLFVFRWGLDLEDFGRSVRCRVFGLLEVDQVKLPS